MSADLVGLCPTLRKGPVVKINDIVRLRFVKDVYVNVTNMLLFLLDKCENFFTKDSHIFHTKKNSRFDNVVDV